MSGASPFGFARADSLRARRSASAASPLVSGVTAAASVDASNEVNRCVLELSSDVKSMTWVFMPFSVARPALKLRHPQNSAI